MSLNNNYKKLPLNNAVTSYRLSLNDALNQQSLNETMGEAPLLNDSNSAKYRETKERNVDESYQKNRQGNNNDDGREDSNVMLSPSQSREHLAPLNDCKSMDIMSFDSLAITEMGHTEQAVVEIILKDADMEKGELGSVASWTKEQGATNTELSAASSSQSVMSELTINQDELLV